MIVKNDQDPSVTVASGFCSSALPQAQEVSVWQAERRPGLEFSSFRGTRHVFPPHFHDAYEFVLIREGVVRIDYRSKSHIALAGSLCAFQPGEVQSGGPQKNVAYTSLYALIEVPLAVELMQEITPERVDPFNLTVLFLSDACVHQFEELCASFWNPASKLERESNLLLFIAELLPHTSDSSPKGSEPAAIALVKDYLRNHLYARVTLGDLSQVTGLSKYHLLRTFKKVVGITPHGFLTSLRIGQARKLLRDQVSVKEVARLSGFADQAHLARLFKRYTGVTPSQYQRGTAN